MAVDGAGVLGWQVEDSDKDQYNRQLVNKQNMSSTWIIDTKGIQSILQWQICRTRFLPTNNVENFRDIICIFCIDYNVYRYLICTAKWNFKASPVSPTDQHLLYSFHLHVWFH